MPALSIHLGVNRYDHPIYPRRPSTLHFAEDDAVALAALAHEAGIATTITLVGAEVTRANLERSFAAAAALPAGSLVVLTFSGHGARLADLAPELTAHRPESARNRTLDGEADGLDELWCLHDGFLLDDELNQHLARLAPGVRALVISDSCHSGTMLRLGDVIAERDARRVYARDDAAISFAANAEAYRQILADAEASERAVVASVIHLAACDDATSAYEGKGHGLFTGAVLDVWRRGEPGGHREFLAAVAAQTRPRQEPLFTTIGPCDPVFEAQRPFTP